MRRGKMGFWFRLAVLIVKPWATVLTRRRWSGQEHIPTSGPVIVAVNHISYVDPFLVAHFVYEAGRLPRFLAKVAVFDLPVGGRILRGAGQIPVHRYSADADAALSSAAAALRAGECVVIYPEGTVTQDPAYWPMHFRTGVARLAFLTGAPVVPVGQWGAQHIFGRDRRLHLLPPRVIEFRAGPPMDLSSYALRSDAGGRALREATDLVLREIRQLVGRLREETPPAGVFDPRTPLAVDDDDQHQRSA